MTGQSYSSSITANIPAAEAAERICRVAEWWTASVTGNSSREGDSFKLLWGDTFVDFTVAEVIPAEKIVWQVTDCNLAFISDKKEWKGTQVVFEISSSGDSTTVTMTHIGLMPHVECYETCNKGWNFYITESLQNLLRENVGFPDMRGKREITEHATVASR